MTDARQASAAFRFLILGSGSSGNATLIEGAGTRVLLDAGLGPRRLDESLRAAGVDPASLSALLLSHEHNDHARGAASFSKRHRVPIRGSRGTRAALQATARAAESFEVFGCGEAFRIGALEIAALPVPHDAVDPVAFVVTCGGLSLGHATDLGHVPDELTSVLGACHVLVLEANYDPAMLRAGPYPWALKQRIASPRGHASNVEAARFVRNHLGPDCRALVLAHLSESNNHPEVVRLALAPALAEIGRSDLRVEIAARRGEGEWIEVAPRRDCQAPDAQLTLWDWE
ncbi:MAG: MBL fold metallo-hydrolase [Vicinamibacteria bacterium]|nr:MBL fold metallo-hydrolase [Vicinamibacteria bacterium]